MDSSKSNKFKSFAVPGWVFLAGAAVFDELILHIWTSQPLLPGRVAAVILFALGVGCLLGWIASLFPPRAEKWIIASFAGILAVLCLLQFFLNDAYQTFMPLTTVLAGAEGVATGFADIVVSQLLRNWWRIVLLMLPVVLFGCFGEPVRQERRWIPGLAAVMAYGLAFGVVHLAGIDAARLSATYNFDSAVHAFGSHMALALDGIHGKNARQEPDTFLDVTMPTQQTTVPEVTLPRMMEEVTEPSTEAVTEPPVVYGVNHYDIDFAALAASEGNSNIAAIHSYVAGLTPSSQNAYTGLFAGKNLIFITAEAFSAEVIDPVLTPTLYRLATEGIEFKEYYQPSWGASTTGGEFSNLLGLIPLSAGCMQEVTEQDMFLTIGSQLQAQGYTTAAFHNNDYTYYRRHRSHPALGYDSFMGMGNGMEGGVSNTWPQSDLEMVDYTLPMYMDQQPFHLYYMSVSGHALYSRDGNNISRKNYAAVADLPYSETVKCYLAANLELEYALASMVSQLEAAGIADDTVIVLATDHYPYGLEKSSTWGNSKDYLTELYGFDSRGNVNRDHNALIIWSGSIEGMDIQVDTPVYSLDILPTLSNLFGVPYDSRLMIGRDVFSDQIPLVIWPDYSWKTELGYYNADTEIFTPTGDAQVEEGYVAYICAMVENKITYSRAVQKNNYFNYLLPYVGKE